jgi:hypothetical protein
MDRINIANLAKGALVEQAESEIQRVLDNIADPNTDPKKARKVQITLTFKPMDRDAASIEIQTKSSIIPYNAVTTQVFIGKDNNGNVMAAEYQKGTIPGQASLIVDTETGEIVKEAGKKILNINR